MKGREIANMTAIYLKALPRCNMKTDCKSCLALTVRESGQDVQVIENMRLIFVFLAA